ncbi:hypothetical protein CYMTET_37036 [Cymbomonas tetramitiformis]|uniref:Uncharacterized protein n=1 Tax=Cymbomonas tetramitiformis TaxID=36881 RepID=A0AAE0F532_9CHLO|nr:hypothetical protein CYMTET_38626 [Cymbomonas tetramitiformis]KAK3253701.1 hypothetical protein CYMTET_37036 [Cymbomonas tetramitiformis]
MYIDEVIADDHFGHAERLCTQFIQAVYAGSIICDTHSYGLIFGAMEPSLDESRSAQGAEVTSATTGASTAWKKGLHHNIRALRPVVQADSMAGVRCFREVLRAVEELCVRLPSVEALRTIRMSLQMYEILIDCTTDRASTTTDYKVGIAGGEFVGLPSPLWY